MTTTMGIPLVHGVHGGMTDRRPQEKREKKCLFGVFFPLKSLTSHVLPLTSKSSPILPIFFVSLQVFREKVKTIKNERVRE